ncbi:MAG TPA: hypothetical protein VGR55_00390 [Candidatus Acidoferrum sp.]|nr:hypothetical protein [Candidatus Acidoferrum sp.]
MAAIWAWVVANKKLLMWSGIAILALVVVGIIRADGISRGKLQAAVEQTADEKKQWQQERETLKGIIAEETEHDRELQEALTEAAQTTKRYAALAESAQNRADRLAEQRTNIASEVGRIPESDLEQTLKTELAIRQSDDTTPGFKPDELRVLLEDVKTRPVMEQEIKELRDGISKLHSEINSLKEQVQMSGQRVDIANSKAAAFAAYAGQLEKHYQTAYNRLPRHRSFGQHICGIFTFYLACKPSKINLPPPLTVQAARPPTIE